METGLPIPLKTLISILLIVSGVFTGSLQFDAPVSGAVVGYEEPIVASTIQSTTFQGPGAATANEAAMMYLTALKAQDVDGMVRTFAIEDWAANFDLEAYLTEQRVWNFSLTPNLLPDSTMGQDYCVYSCLSAVTRLVFYELYSATNEDDDFSSTQVLNTKKDPKAVENFLPHISTLSSVGYSTIRDIVFLSEDELVALVNSPDSYARAQENRMHLDQLMYGAEETCPVVARLTMNGKPCYFFATVGRYGNRWYMLSNINAVSLLLGKNVTGGTIITAERLNLQ